MKRKLAIIGKGTAGILSVNHFNFYCKDDFEIECYYDSSKPEQTVGEGTTVDIPQMLRTTQGLEFNDIFNLTNGNFKTGIHYIGWGDKDYHHTFPMPNASIHFNAVMLQDLLKERNEKDVKFIDKNVTHDDIDADFIIDCSGKPTDKTKLETAEYIPVNTALVKKCYWDYPQYTHTLCIAAQYGWIFGIPLQDRISFGYIHNTDFVNKKKIEQELLEVIDSYNLTPEPEENYIEFGNYYRKENFTERVMYNGNASFFLEPMEATSIGTIDTINRFAYDAMFGLNTIENVNAKYKSWFKQCQDVITMHYLAGSQTFDNDFWQYAKRLATNCYNDKSQMLVDILNAHDKEGFNTIHDYGTWTMESFNQNINGLGLNKDMLRIDDEPF